MTLREFHIAFHITYYVYTSYYTYIYLRVTPLLSRLNVVETELGHLEKFSKIQLSQNVSPKS
jgi:hypothetical protein